MDMCAFYQPTPKNSLCGRSNSPTRCQGDIGACHLEDVSLARTPIEFDSEELGRVELRIGGIVYTQNDIEATHEMVSRRYAQAG